MAKVFQLRRGTRAEHDQFTGVEGEIAGVIDQTNTTDTTIRLHDDVKLGGFEVARADLLNTGDGAVFLDDFATSFVQGGGPDTIIKYDSFGVAQFINDFPGTDITIGSLNVSTLIGPADKFMTFDGAGLVIGQDTIGTADILDESIMDFNIPDDSISTDKLDDLTVGTPDFGYLIVDSVKLADNSVGNPKIENGAVTTSKISDGNINPAIHLVANSITNTKLTSNSITSVSLANNTILKDNVDANSAGNARGARIINDVPPNDVIGVDGDIYYQVQGPNSPPPPVPEPSQPSLPPTFSTPIVISASVPNVDLATELALLGWNGTDTIDTTLTVTSTGLIHSLDPELPALTIEGMPVGSKLTITIDLGGQIIGAGGQGGVGNDSGFSTGFDPALNGKNGGNAIHVISPTITVTLVNNGTVAGGGGGGGGGGASSYDLSGTANCNAGGGGGGGGAGDVVGVGGLPQIIGGTPSSVPTSGANGTLTLGGLGGSGAGGGSCTPPQSFSGTVTGGGPGGAGGDLGLPGSSGSPGLGASGDGPGIANNPGGNSAPGVGGQPGAAIQGISVFIISTPGTILGPQV